MRASWGYPCQGNPINVPVFLTDQFLGRNAVVMVPRWFCAPAEKRTQFGQIYPIIDPRQHYTVYSIDNFQSTIFP